MYHPVLPLSLIVLGIFYGTFFLYLIRIHLCQKKGF